MSSAVPVRGPLVLYASQTGNAEAIAKVLHGDVTELLSNKTLQTSIGSAQPLAIEPPRVMPFSAYVTADPELAAFATERCILLVVSTTGQGDIPDSGRSFFRQLKRLERSSEAPAGSLFARVRFAALGLGDTNYDRFNQGLKSVESQLIKLGAVRTQPSAYADDGTGLEVTVDPWVAAVGETVARVYKDALAAGHVGADAAGAPAGAAAAAPADGAAVAAAAAAAAAVVVAPASTSASAPESEFVSPARPPFVIKYQPPTTLLGPVHAPVAAATAAGDAATAAGAGVGALPSLGDVLTPEEQTALVALLSESKGADRGSEWSLCPTASDPVVAAGVAVPLLRAAAAGGSALNKSPSDLGYSSDAPVLARVLSVKPVCRTGAGAGAASLSASAAAGADSSPYDPRIVLQVRLRVPRAVAALMHPLATAPAESVKPAGVLFHPGDCVAVSVPNPPAAVQATLRRLGALTPTPTAAAAAATAVSARAYAGACAPLEFRLPAAAAADAASVPEAEAAAATVGALTAAPAHLPSWLRSAAAPITAAAVAGSEAKPTATGAGACAGARGSVVSLHSLLAHGLDVTAPPRRALLRALAARCGAAADAERLLALVAKDGKQCMDAVVHGQRLSLPELLSLFPSCRPAAADVVEHTPALQPRQYSIANAPLAVDRTAHDLGDADDDEGDSDEDEDDDEDNDAAAAADDNKPGRPRVSKSGRTITVYMTVVRYSPQPEPIRFPVAPAPPASASASAAAAAAAAAVAAALGGLGGTAAATTTGAQEAGWPQGTVLDVPPVAYPGSVSGPVAVPAAPAAAEPAIPGAGADADAEPARAKKVCLFASVPAPAESQPLSRAYTAEDEAADAAADAAAAAADDDAAAAAAAAAIGAGPRRVVHGVATSFFEALAAEAVTNAGTGAGAGAGVLRSWLSLPGRIVLTQPSHLLTQQPRTRVYLPVSVHPAPAFRLPSDGLAPTQAGTEDDAVSAGGAATPVIDAAVAAAATAATGTNAAHAAAAAAANPPLLLVGPGTGVAPFLGHIKHLSTLRASHSQAASAEPLTLTDEPGALTQAHPRAHRWLADLAPAAAAESAAAAAAEAATAPQDVVLFTGSRARDVDAIDRGGLTGLLRTGAISAVHYAFSRERGTPESEGTATGAGAGAGTKVYVQDRIRAAGAAVAAAVLTRGATVMVCGDGVSMAKGVQQAVEAALAEHGPALWRRAAAAAGPGAAARAAGLIPASAGGEVTEVKGLGVLDFDLEALPEAQKIIWARAYVHRMVKLGRYRTDLWSN
jgi:sulfite reductase alpha subunit-like flavoprotein